MNATICCIVKNEEPYLEEWIEHHLDVGFSKIFVFEDYGSRSHLPITEKHQSVVLRPVADFINDGIPSAFRQVMLYESFFKYARESGIADWVLFIDVDEFFMLDKEYTLDRLLEEFENENGIEIWWKVYDADGQVFHTEKEVTKRFRHVNEKAKLFGKTFANIAKGSGRFLDLHYMEGTVNTEFAKDRNAVSYGKCWINHYYTKSWEEWCGRFLKKGKGLLFPRIYRISDFFGYNPEMEPQKEELMALYERWKREEEEN